MIAPLLAGVALVLAAGPGWTARDWRVFESKVRWGVAHRLDTLPVGAAIARLGATFVGTRYTPGTLEVPGPERVVVNLRELDCVTFVENTLALVRFIRDDGLAILRRPAAARARYEEYLRDLRYRSGVLAGYDSRLHYFSEWLDDNERRGRLTLITGRLGGVTDPERIDFMSTHRTAYRQLADSAIWERIRAIEMGLAARPPRMENVVGSQLPLSKNSNIQAAAHVGLAHATAEFHFYKSVCNCHCNERLCWLVPCVEAVERVHGELLRYGDG